MMKSKPLTKKILCAKKIFTPFSALENACVAVCGEKISYVGKKPARTSSFFKNAAVYDLEEFSLAPGLIDIHVQGAGNCDILDARESSLERIADVLVRNGVTSFLATTVFFADTRTQPHLDAVRKYMRRTQCRGAQILGVHLEGPFINPAKKGMIKTCNIARPSVAYARHVFERAQGTLTMITLAPELKNMREVLGYFRKKKVICSLGHTQATYEEARKAIGRGMRHCTHLFNAMAPFHHRAPGAAFAALCDDSVSVQVIADGKHLHPGVLRLIFARKRPEKICLITDSVSAAGLGDGEYVYNKLSYHARGGLAVYHDGTFIGTAMTLNAMVKRLVRDFAVSLPQALITATVAPARAIGMYSKKGSLEIGKDADIIGLDRALNVRFVMKAGETVINKAQSVNRKAQSYSVKL